MELILLFIIVLQFVYIVLKDIVVARERENMLLKLMSKDVVEYKSVSEPVEEDSIDSPASEVVPIEDVSVEQILKAK